MKRFSYYTLLLLTPLLLCTTACKDDKDDAVSSFRIVKTTIDNDPAALSGEIELSDANFTYEVSGGDWCEVTKNGNLLTLTSGANYDFQNRTVEVVIQAGKTYRVPVTQKGIVFELTDKTRNHFNIGFRGGERTVDFLTNVKYDIVIPDEYKDWISVVDLGDDTHTIVVKESTERREGKVSFKYLEKLIDVTISQFDYMSYTELLGPALMIYTNSEGERVETDIVLEEKEKNSTFTLKGTFESEIPREITLHFLDDATHNGELRFRSTFVETNFEDPERHANIKSLACLIVAYQYFPGGTPSGNLYRPSPSSTNYYPATFITEGTGTRFKFAHSTSGVGNTITYSRVTQGMTIIGTTATGSTIANVMPYDTLFAIEIFKE